MLCGDRDKTINHIINECSKLEQKEYKTRHDWVGNVIYWLWKRLKFDHVDKRYINKSESILENVAAQERVNNENTNTDIR